MITTWRDNLQAASFRGVPFYVDAAESTHGRRIVTHEYPGRDKPYTEDLGRAAVPFGLSAILVGDGYMAARDRLIAALNTPGPGTLIHPYLGTLKVVCKPGKLSESTADGGMARLSLEFIEHGDNVFPLVSEDAASAAVAASVAANAASAASFAKRLLAAVKRAASAVAAAEDAMAHGFVVLRQVIKSPLALSSSVVGQLVASTHALELSASAAMHAPADFAAGVQLLLQQVGAALGISALDGLTAGTGVVQDPATSGVADTARAEAADAVARLFVQAALAAQGAVATTTDWRTRQDAQAARDRYLDRVTAETGVADDDTFAALVDLRAAVDNDVSTRAVDLPDLYTLQLDAPVSSLELAWTLYGDATRSDELEALNDPEQPGWMFGSVGALTQ